MLRPDEYGYEFTRYFRSHHDGRITVIAEGEDKQRAEATLMVLRLNDPELVAARAAAFKVPPPTMPRLRPGLDASMALLRARRFEVSFEDRPYRFHYTQEPVNE